LSARIASQRSLANSAPLSALFIDEFPEEARRLAMPRSEIHLVVRFGPSAVDGVDIHALGPRKAVHRKLVRGGQKSVTARLRLGSPVAVLGVQASELEGRIVPLSELWGDAEADRLRARLAEAPNGADAAVILGEAVSEHETHSHEVAAGAALALAAAERLPRTSVNAVATDLGVSERHLRRVFHEVVGLGPKTFAKLARFHRAIAAARRVARPQWASIAASAGYYDQPHLIAEFRAISGVTPAALLAELSSPFLFG
jgi:AraC-like DNA-binding protein